MRFLVSKPIVSLNWDSTRIRYYNIALDIGLSCFPFKPESKTLVANYNESITVTTENEELESWSEINDIEEDSMPTTADVVKQSLHKDIVGKKVNQ